MNPDDTAGAELSPQSPDSGATGAQPRRAAFITWLFPVLAAVFIIFLISAGLLVAAVAQLNESRLLVARVLTAQSEALEVRLSVREAESHQRGFLLTGDETLLNSYRSRLAEFPGKLAQLDALVNRQDQQDRLNAIRLLAKQKFDEMNETIARYQSGQPDQALALMKSGRGETLMSEISEIFDAFLGVLAERLQVRQEEARSNLWRMWGFAVAAGIATLLLGILVAVLTRMQFVSLRRSEAALQSLNRELEARVVERTYELEVARDRAETLLRDVNHRVGNNLALVSSFLGLQMRTLKDDASRRALASARSRVHTIATTQRKLRLGHADTTRIDALLKDIIDDIVTATPKAESVQVEMEIEPLSVPSDDAVSLGVIVSEMVINAMKYAFPDGTQGRVLVQLRKVGDGAELVVTDDGVGKSESVDRPGEGGLGSQIIYLLSKHFGGEPVYRTGSGGTDRPGLAVVVPLPSLKTELHS